MATKTHVSLVDDLDGGEAEETVTFSLDGRDYEIDLSLANADALREAFATYTEAGRKLARQGGSRFTAKPKPGISGEDRVALKKFAKKNKLPEVGDRGRVHAATIEAWEEAGKPR